ncbi:MAG: arylesterase [Flavobacteriaceae bacterium]|nr:arylesterase [Flavobacteriaceae bacterium]
MKNLGIFTFLSVCLLMVSCKENAQNLPEKVVDQTTDEVEKSPTEKTILFFGTSLTAGLGLDLSEAYPAIIQQKIDSLDLNFTVVNAGLSGDTSASGLSRIGWVFSQDIDVLVLEMGANDGLRGIPLDETERNLQEIIDFVRNKNPEVAIVLAGMQMPPNMGPDYTSTFKDLFPKLAKKNQLQLVPFLLDGVGGIPVLNQADGIHPTAAGQKILAQNVWAVLKSVIIQ